MTDQLALVTGAGRGIGRAIALRLAAARIPVMLVARTPEEVTSVRNEIHALGSEAWAYPCDITDASQVQSLKEDVELELGNVSILVHNAGVAPSAKIEETTDDMWRSTFAVNVDGAFYLTRSFLPALCETGGHIIAIASTAALQGFRFTSAYTASKHAMLGLMRAVAEETRNSGIKVSSICPGFVRTRILEESIAGVTERSGRTREAAEQAFALMNREQKIIEPEEIAETVFQLIAEGRNLRSGAAYHADGTVIEPDHYTL